MIKTDTIDPETQNKIALCIYLSHTKLDKPEKLLIYLGI